MKRMIFPVELSKTWVTTGDTTYCDVKYQLAYRDKTMRELMKILLDDTEWIEFYSGAVGSTRRCEADADNIEIARNISNDKAKVRMERDLRARFYKMRDLLIWYAGLFHDAAEGADDAVRYHQKRRERMMEKSERDAEERLAKAREATAKVAEKVKAEKEGANAEAAKIVEALKTCKAKQIVDAVNEYCGVTNCPVAGAVLKDILDRILRATEKAKAEAAAKAKEKEELEKVKCGIGVYAADGVPVSDEQLDKVFKALLKAVINGPTGDDNAR